MINQFNREHKQIKILKIKHKKAFNIAERIEKAFKVILFCVVLLASLLITKK